MTRLSTHQDGTRLLQSKKVATVFDNDVVGINIAALLERPRPIALVVESNAGRGVAIDPEGSWVASRLAVRGVPEDDVCQAIAVVVMVPAIAGSLEILRLSRKCVRVGVATIRTVAHHTRSDPVTSTGGGGAVSESVAVGV